MVGRAAPAICASLLARSAASRVGVELGMRRRVVGEHGTADSRHLKSNQQDNTNPDFQKDNLIIFESRSTIALEAMARRAAARPQPRFAELATISCASRLRRWRLGDQMSSSEKRRQRRAMELARKRGTRVTHPNGAESGLTQAQPLFQERSLSPPSLPQKVEGAASQTPPGACRALIRRARTIGHWIWYDKSLLATWTFRLFTLLSVGYLVYDRVYETGASVTIVASDPKNPFFFPFSINNNSHIFPIRNVRWECTVIYAKDANNNTFSNDISLHGTQTEIAAGGNLNIDCNVISNTSLFIRNDAPIKQAVLRIELLYESNLFGLYFWERHPHATEFTWISDASNPQWVRGSFAR